MRKLADRSDHPSLDIVSSSGTQLAGRRIVLCVAGSVAAYKSIELARLLMRHGANVTCVASGAATRLISADYLKWATGNDAVTELTGDLEHIRLADYGKADMVMVYPGTANTLGKLANGIDDTPVSTVLAVALGSRVPIVMCLAMHESMYENPAVRRNIGLLKNDIRFLDPRMDEGKAKVPEPEDVLEHVIGSLGGSQVLKGKRVLLTAGPTIEYVDPVRVITNLSSGRTGVLLASELVSAGATVTMVYGPGSEAAPAGARVIRVSTGKEMYDAVKSELGGSLDVVIMAAAASDYSPVTVSDSKIRSTEESLTIRLRRVPKMIDLVRRYQESALLIGFKAEADVTEEELIESARIRMAETGADAMMANDVGREYRMNPGSNRILFIDEKSVVSSGRKPKEDVARFMREQIESRLES